MEGSSHSHSRSYSHSHSRSSHSRAPQLFTGPPATFSGNNNKKPPRFPGGNGGFFTTSYDDVFGGPPTFAALAPRPEDYSEIFGAFRSSSSSSSSIPVLDLPAGVDSGVDSGATLLDYSEVFGGFDAVDFAVPYDQLFRPFDAGDCSSDEAWTPVGTESLSDDSDPFAFSEKSPCFSDGNSHQSLDDKQFNVSYHKVNPGTSTSVPNMTHVAQLNAVPGYTCVVEEAISSKEMEKARFCSTIGDDIILNVDPSSVKSQKHTNRTMSHMSLDDAALRSSDGDRRSGRARSASMSNVNSTFASVSDVNLRTEPTHLPPSFEPPPVSAERKGDFSRLKADPRDSENYGLEATADGNLPYYDMEVDASSSAAVSAAAIKDAMEIAQVKLKAAKVLMDRKKDSFQNGENPSFKTDVKGGERVQTVNDGCASKDERFPTASYRAPAKNKVKSSGEDRHATNASQILPNNSAGEQNVGVTEKLAERKNGKKRSSVLDTAFTGEAGEWKEATQYYEFVNNDTARLAPQWPGNGDGKTAARKQQDSDDEHNSDSADEACAPEENRRRLKATKAVSRQEYYEKMVKVAQEVHNTMIGGRVETEKRLGGVARGNLKQQKGKQEKHETQAQQVEEKKPQKSIRKDEEEIRLRNALEKEEIKQKEKESCHSDRNDRNRNGPNQNRIQEVVESKEEERRINESCQWGHCEERTQETVLGEENEQRKKEACERQRKEKKLAGTPKQTKDNGSWEVNHNRLKEAFDVGFRGEVLQKACESQENDKMQDLRQKKVEDNRSKEACNDVLGGERLQRARQTHQRKVEGERSKEALEGIFGEERLQRTSGTQENGKTKSLQQIYEYENHAGKAVELEGGRKYKEAPEQEKIKQKVDEAQKLVVDCKKSEKSKKQETSDVRLEKSAQEGHVGNESVQTAELEETCKIPDNTGDNDNQKAMHRSRVKTDQTDKDQAPVSSLEIDLSVKDEPLKLPNGVKLNEKDFELDNLTCKLKKPQMEAHDSLVMPAKEDYGDISTVPSDKKSKSETVETADVLIDERQMNSTVAQVGASDRELKRTVHAPETLHTKDGNATSDGVSTSKGHTLNHENKKVGPSLSDPKLVNLEMEREGRREILGEGQGVYDKVDKVKFTPAEGTNGSTEQLRKKEAAPTAVPERKENIQKRPELPTGGESTERKGKIIQEEKKKEKERDLEQEQLRKLEEEKEREREREKDRMAVESAIREARERAYADARDRAERATLERATDEARQRAMAEARERLEKACQEARERSSTDKATEARLRAERAAVERATAEARQRAFEKTMAERVTLEARGRMQRSVSEKYSSERDVAMTMRQSSMPSISERSEGADGEPAQRCKARLERHRRTVERVANALAEKNMRDLLAQREQAERNRIAETLDAEIKRWSSGKEGNLRALLSTLQYILGHDSGWQPIPLTEVITAAAVKKAYRKATLYVHPDKLQQRGATIQQKYICEKVFDLLKEAWNRFNSEEK